MERTARRRLENGYLGLVPRLAFSLLTNYARSGIIFIGKRTLTGEDNVEQ
jgi:hypothetical protein